jgi:hypothetical protein
MPDWQPYAAIHKHHLGKYKLSRSKDNECLDIWKYGVKDHVLSSTQRPTAAIKYTLVFRCSEDKLHTMKPVPCPSALSDVG